ncbi:rhomboid family intramembrane serine protease GlpG [Shewanella yunxiaonensis]|uniref:Rhomboid family intramembrane serine protease GlpG n=1 Tax=Shewanella yunxiaonensis TaxID=2829809 RepID=A0ABX7YUL5_9GAMM|nr:rhomboid family intramembrane serine protease GlpG [Shewanella yunxiaonensis]QUN05871.1 rhomboid family intramembrane serine protease GlpG [Shewanella yunxiaonensis]
MIEIGQLPNERAALALIDYLRGQGIECQLVHLERGVAICVEQPQHAEAARKAFFDFIHNPGDNKYRQASWEHGDNRQAPDYGAPSLQLFSQFITGAGPITLLVMFSCIVIFAIMNLGGDETVFNALGFFGSSANATPAQVWRLFTPSLLHFSALHIVFNLMWWWVLGGRIETRIGSAPLLLLLLVAGTLPNLVQYFVSGPDFGGLSGVVYGLLGYCWLMGRLKPAAGITVQPAVVGFMLLWLAFGFTGMFGLNIANGAHMAGLAVGMAQGWLDSRK